MQTKVKEFLLPRWKGDIVLEEFRIPRTKCSFDFLNLTKRIVIEVQGRQHSDFIPHFHATRLDYWKQLNRDKFKEDWAKANSYIFVEVYDQDLPLTEKWFLEKYGVSL